MFSVVGKAGDGSAENMLKNSKLVHQYKYSMLDECVNSMNKKKMHYFFPSIFLFPNSLHALVSLSAKKKTPGIFSFLHFLVYYFHFGPYKKS